MSKISIVMYSTLEGNSFKGSILAPLISKFEKEEMLCQAYGLIDLRHSPFLQKKNHHVTKIPLIASGITKRIANLLNLPNHYAYLAGELFTGLIFSHKVWKDKAPIILLKPRPHLLVKIARKRNKIIIIDSGEMHPRYYQNKCISEYYEFGIHNKSIFADEYAVRKIEKSLDVTDIVITLTKESYKSYLEHGISEYKLRCIHLGLSGSVKRYKMKYDSNKKIAFFITAHHSILKGTHRVINAWRKVDKKNAQLFIIGTIHDDLKEYLSKVGETEGVIFTGSLSYQEIFDLYKKYNSIGVLCSLSEGFSRSVIEYLSQGMPVIVSPVATCDLVEHQVHGYVVDPTDEDNIKESIEKFIEHSAIYDSFSSNVGKLKIDGTDEYARKMVELVKTL